MDSLVPRLKTVLDDHLVELFEAGMCADQAIDDTVAEPTRWDLLATCRLDPHRPPSGPYRRISDRKVSRTAPDAAAMQLRDGRTVLGYQDHYLVDGGKARIILHAFVTPGDVAENMVLLDQLARTMFRRKLRPRRVIADAKYATTTNIRTLEDAGIRAYVPLPEWDKASTRFKRAAFTYEPVENIYRCPQGETLHLHWTDRKGEQWLYRARATACNGCAVKDQCTTSSQGGCFAGPFTNHFLSVSAPMLAHRRSSARCASGAPGSRGCSPRRSSGTGYTDFACAA